MKKVLIIIFASGFITIISCNSENKIDFDQEQSIIKTEEDIKGPDKIDKSKKIDLEIPQFDSDDANKFIKKYISYAEEVKNAEESDDSEVLINLIKQSPAIEKEKLNLIKSLSKEDAEKLNEFSLRLIQSINHD